MKLKFANLKSREHWARHYSKILIIKSWLLEFSRVFHVTRLRAKLTDD